MKKLVFTAIAGAIVVFFIAMIIQPLSAQKGGQMGKPIPADVLKIAEKSCVKCHSEPGSGMALMHLNLSNWDKYSPEKQAAKAEAMCKMVTKEKMPPRKFKESHPDGIPSKEEIKIICDWAQSIKVAKK
jgi:hypothetical protein